MAKSESGGAIGDWLTVPVFEEGKPSARELAEALTVWDAIKKRCPDTYQHRAYDPPVTVVRNGIETKRTYVRGWFRGGPEESERELAERLVRKEMRASGCYQSETNERGWLKPLIFRMFIPHADTNSAVNSNGQVIFGLRIHERTGPSAMRQIEEYNQARVKAGTTASNVTTEAKELEKWAYDSPQLGSHTIPDAESIRVKLQYNQRLGEKVVDNSSRV